jgi:hypothetical protein
MSSLLRQSLGTVQFGSQVPKVDIPRGMNVHGIEGIVRANVTITAGGGVDGALLTEGAQRMIQQLRVRHDGDDRVSGLDGRRLYKLTARDRLTITPATQLAGAAVQAATPVGFDFALNLARPQLAQPVLTAWPAIMPIRTELAIYVDWNLAAAGGTGSGQGTGALISGGDRVVTFSTPPTLELVLVYSLGDIRPWYLARFRSDTSNQFSSANTQLPYLLAGNKRVLQILHRDLNGATGAAQDGINALTLSSGGGSNVMIGSVPFPILQRSDAGQFPAAEEAGQTGEYFQNFADNGLLGTVLDPRPLSQPRFLYDVDAPSSAPGWIDLTFVELDTLPGVTQVTA